MKYALVFLCLIMFSGCDFATTGGGTGGIASDTEYLLEDYFPTTPGYCLEYDFTNEKFGNGKRWVTFQDKINDKIRYTYSAEDNKAYGAAVLYGTSDFPVNARQYSGANDHLAYSTYLTLPKKTTLNRRYQTDLAGQIKYEITKTESFGSFPACIRIDFDASQNGEVDLRGKGYFLLAKDVGIVYMFFEHTEAGRFGDAGKTYSYTLKNHSQESDKKTLKGSVTGTRLPLWVAVSGRDIRNDFFGVETDSAGNFSVQLYYKSGTNLMLTAGYDADGNRLFDKPPPFAYPVNNLAEPEHNAGTITYEEPTIGEDGNPIGFEYLLEEYFPTTPGYCLEYDFTNEQYGSGKRWVTFQEKINSFFRYSYTSESNKGYGIQLLFSDETAIHSSSGTGSNDHVGYSSFLYLPKKIKLNEGYKNPNTDYQFSKIASFGLYQNCVRIDFDSTKHTNANNRGKGYFLLAKDVGIAYMFFKHTEDGRFGTAGKTYTYTLKGYSQESDKKTLKGQIENDRLPILVSINGFAAGTNFFSTETDADGNFSLQFYYKDGTNLTIVPGYDTNGDGVLDNYIKYPINNLIGPVHDAGTIPYSLSADYLLEEYFPTTPGYCLEYDFTNEKFGNGKRWVTFQDKINGLTRYFYTSESTKTYGTQVLHGNENNIMISRSGTGAGDQSGYILYLYLPKKVKLYEMYRDSSAFYRFSQIVPFGSFTDCIRIDFDTTQDTDVNLRGTGYFLLAKNVGLVYIFFKHTEDGRFGAAGKTYTYTLTNRSQETAKKTLKGRIASSSLPIFVGINGFLTDSKFFSVQTDADGNFSLPFYHKEGTGLTVTIGYDKDGEIGDRPPFTHQINNLSGPVHDAGTISYPR